MLSDLRDGALLGTGRARPAPVQTDGEIDALLSSLGEQDTERRLLLTAGVLAVWERAGYQPGTAPDLEKAPPDTLPGCSDETADLIRRMASGSEGRVPLRHVLDLEASAEPTGLSGGHQDLLPEALDLLRRRGLRLRYHLLPNLLGARVPRLRSALRPVIGQRGHWLAGFNPVWVWAAGELPPYADWLWEKGKTEYRVDLIELHRRLDSAAARARVEERFFSERPDVRAKLLNGLEHGLSDGDEPFLERVLDGPHAAVRLRAAKLLAKLPESPCAQRIRDRADGMLAWSPGRLGRGTLEVRLPDALDPAWEREGLARTPRASSVNAPGVWLRHTVGLVPTRHWIARFGLPLQTLIAGVKGARALGVLEAWTDAAVLHGERDVMPALWDTWWERRQEIAHTAYQLESVLGTLAGAMDPADLENRLARLLADPPAPEWTCGRVLAQTPCPWPQGTGDTFLRGMREAMRALGSGKTPSGPWIYVLGPAARGVPSGSIDAALGLVSNFHTENASLAQWQQAVELMAEKLRLRQRYIEELNR